MNFQRYAELRDAGPKITFEDIGRLRNFRPKLTPIAIAIGKLWNVRSAITKRS